VKFRKKLTAGKRVHGLLKLITNDEHQKEVFVQYSGFSRIPAQPNIKNVVFHVSAFLPNPHNIVVFRNPHMENFKIVRYEIITNVVQSIAENSKNFAHFIMLKPSNDDLLFEVKPRDESGTIALELTFNRNLGPGEMVAGQAMVWTNDPEQKEITIQYMGSYR